MNNQERNTATVLDREETNAARSSREATGPQVEPIVRAVEGIRENLDHLGMKIGTARDTVFGKTREYWQTTDNYVGRNPWVAVGLSAGVAFLAGMLIGRRRND